MKRGVNSGVNSLNSSGDDNDRKRTQPPVVNPAQPETQSIIWSALEKIHSLFSKARNVTVQKVRAFDSGQRNLPLDNADKIGVYCPPSILNAFHELIGNTSLAGTSFFNPYTNTTEIFPNNPKDFTARHLQILARNEEENIDGVMKVGLYQELLSPLQIATLRCLVKSTVVSGLTVVLRSGGFPNAEINPIVEKNPPQVMILIDQAGFQWQEDFHNTGGMFFYPERPTDETYTTWQNAMYKTMYGHDRPTSPSVNHALASWNGKRGKLDLNQVAMAIQCEFMQAMDAAAKQSAMELEDQKINFRYLKAGMGFFASGLTLNKKPGKDNPALLLARLQGIENALGHIAGLSDADRKNFLKNIARLELPFSESLTSPEITDKLRAIEQLATRIGIEWGGAAMQDALNDNPPGFITALTNTADPHAMIGNEGYYGSVDAAIVMNASVNYLNAAYNTKMGLRYLIEAGDILRGPENAMLHEPVVPSSEALSLAAAAFKPPLSPQFQSFTTAQSSETTPPQTATPVVLRHRGG